MSKRTTPFVQRVFAFFREVFTLMPSSRLMKKYENIALKLDQPTKDDKWSEAARDFGKVGEWWAVYVDVEFYNAKWKNRLWRYPLVYEPFSILICSPAFKKNPEASFTADLPKAHVMDEYKQSLVQEYAQSRLEACIRHAESYQEFWKQIDRYFIKTD